MQFTAQESYELKYSFDKITAVKGSQLKNKQMKIIPAIDIIDGKCVRLSKGDYSTSKIYNEDPVEVPKSLKALEFNIFIWWILMGQNQNILSIRRYWKI
jgi:phosphoribosylformimino-5-aminoimidazole carboxamide ribotide isomerase